MIKINKLFAVTAQEVIDPQLILWCKVVAEVKNKDKAAIFIQK